MRITESGILGLYHENVHRLVQAGWINLKDLDNYMTKGIKYKNVHNYMDKVVISVLEIKEETRSIRRWPDIHSDFDLKQFLEKPKTGLVRLYMVEQEGNIAPGLMEAFGSSLRLEAMFFQDTIADNNYLLSPPQRNVLPFTTIPFMIPKTWMRNKSDLETWTVQLMKGVFVQIFLIFYLFINWSSSRYLFKYFTDTLICYRGTLKVLKGTNFSTYFFPL